MGQHTPGPWTVQRPNDIYADGTFICRPYARKDSIGGMQFGECLANAKLIVRAVNCHDDLITALMQQCPCECRRGSMTDDFGNATTQAVTVGAGATVNLGGIAAKFLYVQCPSAVNLNLNGLGFFEIAPRVGVGTSPPSYPARYLVYGNNLTSLSIQNLGAAAVVVTVVYAS